MATKKKKRSERTGYNTRAAYEGAVGAPPLARSLKAATGRDIRSCVLRVDLDFANHLRQIAKQEKRTVTSITRDLLAEMK